MIKDVRSSATRARAAWSAGAVLLAGVTVLLAGIPPAAASGGVALFDDDGGAGLFTGALSWRPDAPRPPASSVDASGADPSDTVVLSADDLAGTLVPYLTVTVDVGSSGHMGDCSGFTADMLVAPWSGRLSDLATPVPTGSHPGTAGTRTFRFTVRRRRQPGGRGPQPAPAGSSGS